MFMFYLALKTDSFILVIQVIWKIVWNYTILVKYHQLKKDSIFLQKEGIFWRAYNRSAMRLHKYIKSYNWKFIKTINRMA